MDLLLTKREGVLWKRWGHSVSVAQVWAFQLVMGCFYRTLWAENPGSPGTPTKKRETKVWDSSSGLHLKETSQSKYRVILSSTLW